MHLTQHELNALAEEADHTHREGMKHFREQTSELHLDSVRSTKSRLAKPGAVVGAAVLTPLLLSRSFASAAPRALDDKSIAGFAQSFEYAAVAAYKMAAPLLDPATATVATLFAAHHQQHGDAFGSLAGDKAVKGPNEKIITALTPTLQGLKDQMGVLEFAFNVENEAAYTYAAGLTLLQDPAFAGAASTILPIESQHAVVLGLALGKPVTDVFPTMAFESTKLGPVDDPKSGVDPAIYG